ncbi:MAG: substrate-binding domain-containing protein [Lachnospiraceae bacterium]|jgi:ABC-type sugar transport system substrate-binding protein
MLTKKSLILIFCLMAVLCLSGCRESVKTVIEKDPLFGGDGIEIIDTDKTKPEKKEYTQDGQEIISAENTEAVVYLIIPSEEKVTAEEKELIVKGAEGKNYTLEVRNFARETDLQSRYFDEAIDVNASMIICDNIETEVTSADCQRAKDAGIPVILLNRGISSMGIASYQIITDYFSSAKNAALKYAEYKNGESKYLALYDIGEENRYSFERGLKDYEKITMLGSGQCDASDAKASYDAAWAIMSEYPNADTIVCDTSLQALQAIEAMRDIGNHMTVVCLCGDDDRVVAGTEEGRLFASICKDPSKIAEKVTKVVDDYIDEGVLPENESVYVDAVIRIYDPKLDPTLRS